MRSLDTSSSSSPMHDYSLISSERMRVSAVPRTVLGLAPLRSARGSTSHPRRLFLLRLDRRVILAPRGNRLVGVVEGGVAAIEKSRSLARGTSNVGVVVLSARFD